MQPTNIFRGQDWLIARMQKIISTKQSGICFGVAYMGMQAILAEGLDQFDQRLKLIRHIPLEIFSLLIDRIKQEHLLTVKQNKERISSPKKLNSNAKILDIPIFFEGIELYQHGDFYPRFFSKKNRPKSQNGALTAPLVIPDKLKQQGGIVEIDQFTGSYQINELRIYFESLQTAIDNSADEVHQPIVLVLHSSNHSITVGYDIKNQWSFINANELLSQRLLDPTKIASKVLNAFSKNGIGIFATRIYTTRDNEATVNHLVTDWKKQKNWQDIHAVSSEKVKLLDSFQSSWLYVAAKKGDSKLVKKLLAAGADPNLAPVNDIPTPLFIATQGGHFDVVKILLAAAKVDPNQASNGLTPLYVAAQNGDSRIVEQLLLANADPNLATEGVTPLFIAAQDGHLDIVKLLLRNSATLLTPYKSTIESLRDSAKYYEIEKKMEAFIKTKQDLSPNLSEIEMTAEEIARIMGHTEIANLLSSMVLKENDNDHLPFIPHM